MHPSVANHIDVQSSSSPGATKSTVFKNPDGSVEFPSVIPPEIDFPVTTPGGTKKVPLLPNQSTSDLHNAPNPHQSVHTEGRPLLPRTWGTERPPVISTASSKPLFARAGTNVSALNTAIWSQTNDGDETSSGSSDDEPPQIQRRKRIGRKRHINNDDEAFGRFSVGNNMFKTKGKVSKKDGRLNISVNDKGNSGYLAKAIGAGFLGRQAPTPKDSSEAVGGPLAVPSEQKKRNDSNISTSSTVSEPSCPKLSIVIMVIGSRGDIQPFLKLGKVLKEECGHRVRIATHPAFREFVQNDSGLEFFSVGGDPAELMAFMVKNPGMIPKMDTIKAGEIGRRRDQMADMFEGFWRACINATDDEHDPSNVRMMGDQSPFVADAIIANPPCFAHVHCAERLGIPLHLMFTFPYTPTQAFPHPLANIKKSNVDPGYSNFMSYPLVEMMTWQGLGDLVNNFRVRTLGLEPVSTLWAPGQLYRLKVPYTYLWSPGLVPKPEDWGPEIDIAGFVFLDLASSFDPPEDLVKFLDAGEPPIYIGFGSIVVDDPDQFTKMIFNAVEKAGVRALVSKGWGALGDDNVPDNVYMLENTPHDWLFPKVKAVVHHGGAGTTAIGLKCGKPTMIVPFFGDQQFWGNMIGKAGAGPEAIPYKDLTMEKLAEGLKQLLTDDCAVEAQKIAKSIEEEGDGAHNAVKSFQRSLLLHGDRSMRCSILEDRVAVWVLKGTQLRLSALAANILVQQKKVAWKNLRLIRHNEWNDFEGPGEPITGITTSVMRSLTSMATGIGGIPFRITKHSKKRQKHEQKKRRKNEQADKGGSTGRDAGSVKAECKKCPAQNGNAPGSKPDKIADEQAPAKAQDKATSGDDLGKHTVTGEPADPGHGSAEHKRDDEDNVSVLSADPEQGAAEEIAQDVGVGFGKTGEALARGKSIVTYVSREIESDGNSTNGSSPCSRPRFS